MQNLWLYILRLWGRITRLEKQMSKLTDDVTKLETLVPGVIAQSEVNRKKAETAQALAEEYKAELDAAEDPDTTHRLEVLIEALSAYAPTTATDTTTTDGTATTDTQTASA